VNSGGPVEAVVHGVSARETVFGIADLVEVQSLAGHAAQLPHLEELHVRYVSVGAFFENDYVTAKFLLLAVRVTLDFEVSR